ncbi:MAG: hypothetical protein HZB91_10905, partial [Elusimicrobia bacterium]|nr:hypothetical protein [Elusimicrobiota bacterium]
MMKNALFLAVLLLSSSSSSAREHKRHPRSKPVDQPWQLPPMIMPSPGTPFVNPFNQSSQSPSWTTPVMPVNVYPPGMATPAPVESPEPRQSRHEEWKPPPKGDGPEMPPVMVSFPDTYAAVVKAYLHEAAAQNDGDFLVKDEVTGHVFRLTLLDIPKDKIVYLSPDQAFACVPFQGAAGEKLDLDIYVKKTGIGEWTVSKVYLHKIDGKERFVYGPNYQPMTPESAALAAAASAGAAAAQPQARKAASPAKAPEIAAVPKPQKPAKLSLQVSFREPSANGMLDGGERGTLSVAVFNAGPGPAYAVRVAPVLQSKSQVSLPAFVEVGTVKAG